MVLGITPSTKFVYSLKCAKAHSFLLKKSVLDKKPPGGKIDSSAWRLLKHQKYCFVWEKCDYSASFA